MKKNCSKRRSSAAFAPALAAALLAMALGSCATGHRCAQGSDLDGPFYHSSRISLDWWGDYEGTVPSASGSGIEVRLTLNRDYTFELRYEYLGREDGAFAASGTFRWNDAGTSIALEGHGGAPLRYPPFYQVGEAALFQLDMDGNRITGALGEYYILRKAPQEAH